MSQRVFVNVIGFSDVERHALNTVFRLSEPRETSYAPWTPEVTEQPRLILMDGDCYEALLAMASPDRPDAKLIWIGPDAPPYTWRRFERPLHWPDVVAAMDDLFSPPESLDFDLDADFDGSPPDTLPPGAEDGPPKRALIVAASLDERLYLRARLALSGLTLADEAETAAQALELAGTGRYAVALVDFGLPEGGWNLLKLLRGLQPVLPHLVVTKHRPTRAERLRARLAGVEGFFDKPPHPGKLSLLLQKV